MYPWYEISFMLVGAAVGMMAGAALMLIKDTGKHKKGCRLHYDLESGKTKNRLYIYSLAGKDSKVK